MTATQIPSRDGLDHSKRLAEYRIDWETDITSGSFYANDLNVAGDYAALLRKDLDAHVEVKAWDDYTNGYNARVAD